MSRAGGEEYRGSEIAVPSGAKARFQANVAAIRLIRELEAEPRDVTAEDQAVLAAWSGWGAVAGVFEGREEWTQEADELRSLLTTAEYASARANTLNAHYTDPAIATAMWEVLAEAGLGDATVLEPGCGSGTFMAAAPEGARVIGVELDPLTARIAHHLHPKMQVRLEGFEKTLVRPGMVDAAIGNVPFGNFTLHDPVHNSARMAIHNHFIAKSLSAVRPGGMVALVTSAWTMDSASSAARREIAKLGDLVAAVRLPGRAFTRVAGTDVTTDVLVFQRRTEDLVVPNVAAMPWGESVMREDGVAVNRFFEEHPERVLGEAAVRTGRFGPVLEVTGASGAELAEQVRDSLRAQLAERGARIPERTEALALRPGESSPGLFARLPENQQPMAGALVAAADVSGLEPGYGGFVSWTGTDWEQVKVSTARAEETRRLLIVRDALSTTLRLQADPEASVADRTQARSVLNTAYDHYVDAHGPINRFTLRETPPTETRVERAVAAAESEWRRGLPEWMEAAERAAAVPSDEQRAEWREDAITELTGARKMQEHLRPLRTDPGLGSMLGLEIFDEETQTARKSRLFSEDVVSAATAERTAETVDDAVAISMDERQRVEPARVAELLGISEDEAREQLQGAAFVDPVEGRMVPASMYLSGAVRDKLDAARAAAADDPAFEGNVAALEAALPEWVSIEQIDLVPGVGVLDADDYGRFVRETFGVDVALSQDTAGRTWKVASPSAAAFSEDVLFRFGTANRKPTDLLEAVMNQKPTIIRHKQMDGTTVVDRPQTAAARQKCDAITAAFQAWVMADPTLRERVENVWNATFNQMVAPDYSALGARLALPGLSEAFTPHPHQREGVARILHDPATLLNHVVGAGKTGTMVMAAMELRRTGQARKPWMVVPNHLVEQVTREAGQWYPNIRVMSIPSGLNPSERQMWMARSAGQDWDLVVCPQSVFKLMGVDPGRAQTWVQAELDDLTESRNAMEGDPSKWQVKAIEKQVKTLEAKSERLLQAKDPGMTFEQTGCDFLLVDEAHNYKNLSRSCDISDLSCAGSQIASDLDMKLQVMREFRIELAHRDGTWHEGMVPHVAAFATGTPVANNLAEMWVMQRFLRPDLLEAQGTASLREWARTFARSSQELEMKSDGSTWVVKDRVRSFANLPELLQTNRAFMSTVRTEDLDFALPTLEGGERTTVIRPASDQVREYMRDLKARADNPPSDPSLDNPLKIMGDGRRVALDPRMVGLDEDPEGGRIGEAAEKIAAIYRETEGNVYTGADGEPEPITGGLQIVFCDQGIPGGDQADLYSALRDRLALQGVPAEKVAFIHDAATDEERGRLFARCRDGQVNVLIGSTQRMGTGVNVQKRAVALHHLDVPWRPADLEQREGRILRQGNQNERVRIFSYVTTATLDALQWQTVERKARFISQVMSGSTTARSFEQEQDDDMRKFAAMLAAAATDNPLVMERAEVMNKVLELDNLAAAHRSEVGQLRSRILSLNSSVATAEREIPRYEAAIALARPGTGFTSVTGQHTDSVNEAAEWMRGIMMANRVRLVDGSPTPIPLGTVDGFAVSARANMGSWSITADATDLIGLRVEGTRDAMLSTNFALRLRNQVERLEEGLAAQHAKIASSTEDISQVESVLDSATFAQADELVRAQTRLAEIDAQLGMSDEDAEAEVPMVYADVLREKLGRDGEAQRVRDLRIGDVFGISRSKGHWVVEANDGDSILAFSDADPEEKKTLRSYEAVELIARQQERLTGWELALVQREPADRVAPISKFEDGTRVLIASADGGVEQATIRTEQKVRAAYVDQPGSGRRITDGPAIAKDYYSPEQLAAKAAVESMAKVETLLPGSVVVRAVDEQGRERKELIGAVPPGPSSPYLVTREGEQVNATGIGLEALPPRALSAEELASTGVDGPVPVTNLRVGDLVALREIDRAAHSDRLVRVLGPANGWTRSAETFYVSEEGDFGTAKIRKDSEVTVLERAWCGLRLHERVEIGLNQQNAGHTVQLVPVSELDQHVGARFACVNGSEVVDGVLLPSRPVTYGHPRFTIERPNGTRLDLTLGGPSPRIQSDADLEAVKRVADPSGGNAALIRAAIGGGSTAKTAAPLTPPPGHGPSATPGVRM